MRRTLLVPIAIRWFNWFSRFFQQVLDLQYCLLSDPRIIFFNKIVFFICCYKKCKIDVVQETEPVVLFDVHRFCRFFLLKSRRQFAVAPVNVCCCGCEQQRIDESVWLMIFVAHWRAELRRPEAVSNRMRPLTGSILYSRSYYRPHQSTFPH